MIKISVYKDENGRINGFHSIGHAGYAQSGSDIICAAVSALTMTAVNSIETFTSDTFTYDENEELGEMELHIQSPMSNASELLLNSLVLGLESIEEAYGRKYIQVNGKK